MPATSQYHVVLDGQGYLIDLATYKKLVHDSFVPKLREGDPGYRDSSFTAVWAQEGWARGLALERWDDSWRSDLVGYASGYSIDPHYGDLRLGRVLTSRHAPAYNEIAELLRYNDALYATRGDGQEVLKSTDGTTWSTSLNSGLAGLRNLARFNGWLIVASHADGKLLKYDGAAWTNPWVTLTAAEVQGMCAHPIWGSESLFCGCRQAASRTNVLNVVSTAGTAATLMTFRDPYVETLFSHDGLLWIVTYDDTGGDLHSTIYTYDGVGFVLTEVTRVPDNVPTCFCEYHGKLYAGSRTRGLIWELTSKGLEQRFRIPGFDGIGGVSTYDKPIRAMVVDDDRMHVPVYTAQGLGLFSFDGQGWAHLASGGTASEPRFIQPFKGSLYLSTYHSAGARIYEVEKKAPTSGALQSATFDAGLAVTDKLWLQIDVYHSILNTNESVLVEYMLEDSGVWLTAGTSNTVGATSKSFTLPTGTRSKTIQLQLTLSVSTQTHTPKVTSVLTSYLVVPDVKAEWEFSALLEGSAQTPLTRLDNSAETKTGPQLASALWTSRAKKQTLSFTDLNTDVKTVMFVALEEHVAKETQRLGAQTRGKIRLVEM